MKQVSLTSHGLWELAVLCLLREAPMHPYEMKRVLWARHKNEVLVLKKGSLYHAIERLLHGQLITAAETSRDGRRPERTTYRITQEGEQELGRWLREMIATPRREPSEFMACVSFLLFLTPEEAIAQLEQRAQRLEEEVATIGVVIAALIDRITRVNLLESEYLRTMRQAELTWVRGLIADLRSGALAWDLEKIFAAIRAAKTQAAMPKEA